MAKLHLFGLLLVFLLLGCSEPSPEPVPAAPEPASTASAPIPTTMIPSVEAAGRTGAEIVNQYCSVCHARGLYNAPKIGDTAAWQGKLMEGREHLWQVVLQGEKAMPPRGNCHDCTDDELRAAMDYLLAAAVEPSATVRPTPAETSNEIPNETSNSPSSSTP